MKSPLQRKLKTSAAASIRSKALPDTLNDQQPILERNHDEQSRGVTFSERPSIGHFSSGSPRTACRVPWVVSETYVL